MICEQVHKAVGGKRPHNSMTGGKLGGAAIAYCINFNPLHMPNTSLVFYVKLFVKPEYIQEWREAFDEIVTAMSREAAFISCDLHQDAMDPTQFTLYERWTEPSVESFLQNQMKPYRLAYDAKLERLLQRPREPQILRPLGSWRGAAATSD